MIMSSDFIVCKFLNDNFKQELKEELKTPLIKFIKSEMEQKMENVVTPEITFENNVGNGNGWNLEYPGKIEKMIMEHGEGIKASQANDNPFLKKRLENIFQKILKVKFQKMNMKEQKIEQMAKRTFHHPQKAERVYLSDNINSHVSGENIPKKIDNNDIYMHYDHQDVDMKKLKMVLAKRIKKAILKKGIEALVDGI